MSGRIFFCPSDGSFSPSPQEKSGEKRRGRGRKMKKGKVEKKPPDILYKGDGMTKKANSGSQSVETAWTNLSVGITDVIKELMKQRGISMTKLAKEIKYAQSSLSDIFAEKSPETTESADTAIEKKKQTRRWSFPLLLLVSNHFGVPLHEIIRAAETKETIPWLTMRLAKTPPHTMDRLELIVQSVAPEGTAADALNLYYTSQMFSLAAPDYVNRYIDGELSDEDVYRQLVAILESEPPEGNLWGGVKRTLNPGGDGPFSEAKKGVRG